MHRRSRRALNGGRCCTSNMPRRSTWGAVSHWPSDRGRLNRNLEVVWSVRAAEPSSRGEVFIFGQDAAVLIASHMSRPLITVMLAVPDAPAAVEWYTRALGARQLWSLGSVAGLEIGGAPFFVGEPAKNRWETPARVGITTTRIEVFSADPDPS